MKRQQINELNMYETEKQFLNSNTAVWSSNPTVSAAIATYMSLVAGITANDAVQKTSTIGVTNTKQTAKLNMATAAVAIANAGKAYATATSNQALFNDMSHGKTEIIKASDTDANGICQNIVNAITPYIASTTTYGATATSLTNLQNLINTYYVLIGTPAIQKSLVTTATLSLDQQFSAVNALFKNLLDPLMQQYQTSNVLFYNQYTALREINDIGHRHTVILKGFIYNTSNQALPNAVVSLSGGATHTKITKATGQYKFVHLNTGNYTITVTVAGYVTQSQNLTIVQNSTTHTDFIMVSDGGVGTGIGVGMV